MHHVVFFLIKSFFDSGLWNRKKGVFIMSHLETFDTTIQKTNIWLKDIMEDEGWEDRHKSYLALRAVLHALRDRLGVQEAVHLASELPMLVRGFYFEGWDPSGKPERIRSKEEFLEKIAQGLPDDPELDPERVARGVFALLAKKISEGEINDIKSILPKEIRELWPRGNA
jgi:uncharacterized protein (DUF2267 family)